MIDTGNAETDKPLPKLARLVVGSREIRLYLIRTYINFVRAHNGEVVCSKRAPAILSVIMAA